METAQLHNETINIQRERNELVEKSFLLRKFMHFSKKSIAFSLEKRDLSPAAAAMNVS